MTRPGKRKTENEIRETDHRPRKTKRHFQELQNGKRFRFPFPAENENGKWNFFVFVFQENEKGKLRNRKKDCQGQGLSRRIYIPFCLMMVERDLSFFIKENKCGDISCVAFGNLNLQLMGGEKSPLTWTFCPGFYQLNISVDPTNAVKSISKNIKY